MPITYNPTRQRYVNDQGKIANEAAVRRWMRDEIGLENLKLKKLMSQRISERISTAEWKTQTLEELRSAHLKMAAIAAGGEDRLTPDHYALVNQMLWQEEGYLNGFGADISSGKLFGNTQRQTRTGLLYRASLYGDALKLTFYAVELAVKKLEGGWLGWRKRDPATKSCKQCTQYDTHGWVDVAQITPIGWDCACRNRCQCRITYRRAR